MKLVAEWRRALLSISFWMQIAGMLVLIVPEMRYHWTGQDYDPFIAWWASMLLLIAGTVGRLLQQGLKPWQEALRIAGIVMVVIALAFVLAGQANAAPGNQSPATEEETLSLAVPYIMKKEGIRLVAYRDIVGVWTICGGITAAAGIRIYPGMTMTMQRCTELMWVKVAEYRSGLHRYFTAATIALRLPPTRDTAYTSLAYNVGIVGIGKSTAVRRLNAGDVRGGCEAITWYDKAGGRVVRGLFERRKDEKAKCLIGA